MLNHLSNPLATTDQLSTSASQLDGVPADLELSVRYAAVRLTQAAGVLLQLPQDIIAQGIVTLTRFWLGPEGGSLGQYNAKDISASSLYLMAKLSPYPVSPRSLTNVYAYLMANKTSILGGGTIAQDADPLTYYVSEDVYHQERSNLMKVESLILRTLGFQTHVALPYTLAINYLQALDIYGRPQKHELSQRVFAHLNGALFSPQLVYLTHQPPALATAAIYLAARELGVKMPDGEWWEVFDVDREELGFLVVAMQSLQGFAEAEKEKWKGRTPPIDVKELNAELASRGHVNGG